MPSKTRKNTRRLTLCAICCALGVIIMSLGSLIEVLDLSTSALAAILIVFIVIEIGGFWPWLVWAATGFISLWLPLKLAAVFYFSFAGYYPIIKEKIEKLHSRILQWILKIILLNIALTFVIIVGKYILALPDTELSLTWLLYLMANLAFALFDIALTRLITLYLVKWRVKLRIHGLK